MYDNNCIDLFLVCVKNSYLHDSQLITTVSPSRVSSSSHHHTTHYTHHHTYTTHHTQYEYTQKVKSSLILISLLSLKLTP